MIKIAHFGDVHWRSLSRHQEYKRSFEDAFEKLEKLKPDVILVAGDIVHSKTQGITPELITYLTWWFRSLSRLAPVHVTLGNHDGLVLNPDREDAITPIINAIGDPNIHLYKKSGCYPLTSDGSYNLAVFSCFDEDGWDNVSPVPDSINIATYHGPVVGSETDSDWRLDSDIRADFFKQYDYVMLGDIHRQQFLGNRVAYCGSTIQQNYGETPGKGFLFWAIDGRDFKVKHVEVKHESPFVTLQYEGDLDDLQTRVEEHPERSRFRIRVDDYVTHADRKQIRAAIKGVAKPLEIVFKVDSKETDNEIADEFLDDHESISSYEDVWSLVQEYYANTELHPNIHARMSAALASAWNTAKISNDIASGRWSLRKLEFDNVFGYGENNVVNIDSTSGITGIFGKNRSGKSSICGAMTYALFNGTDRGAMKNLHVINARKNFCRVKAMVSKQGNNFLVERQSVKKSNRKGDVSAVTHLNFFECDDAGHPTKDLTGEQRRETEKELRKQLGTLEDFLMTTLASQGDINRFVSKGSAERKFILAKFLRLDILETLQNVLKTDVNAAKAILAKFPEKEFDAQIIDKRSKIEARKSDRDQEKEAVQKITQILNDIKSALDFKGQTAQYTQIEVEEQQKRVADLDVELTECTADIETTKIKSESVTEKLQELLGQISVIDVEELRATKNKIVDTERNLLIASGEIDSKSVQLKADKKQVKKLSDVPCGDAFPTCKYIVSARKAEKSMLERKEDLASTKKYARMLKSELKKLMSENVDAKLSKKRTLDQKIAVLKQDGNKLEMNLVKLENLQKNLDRQITQEKNKLDKMMMNLCDDETAKQREILIKKQRLAEKKLGEANGKVQSLSEKIGLLTAEVDQLIKDKESFQENTWQYNSLNLLHRSLRRDGIPLQIVKRKLPVINREIANILTGVTGFTVELESNNTGMDIILDYGDSRRVIECCSGMEKMMASLAIRTALIRVSSLPKSDMLIIDEGFGALDASNIEACTSLLRSLTKTFRTILIISHIDSVKDVGDNVFEISSSSGHDSKVTFL